MRVLFSKGLFSAPATTKAIADCTSRYTGDPRPLSNSQRLTIACQSVVSFFVVGLFVDRGPSTILGTIWAVGIDAVKGCSGWAFSHVGDEVGDRLQPALTDSNATPAIMRIGVCRRVIASIDHCAVGAAKGVICKSVGLVSGVVKLCAVTATAFSLATPEIAAFHLAGIATVAHAVPDGFAIFVNVGESDNQQAAETLTCNVLDSWAELRDIMGLHREPPKFSVTSPRLLAQRWGDLFCCTSILQQNIACNKGGAPLEYWS